MTNFEKFVMWTTWIVMLGFIIINALQHTGVMYHVEVLEIRVEELTNTQDTTLSIQEDFLGIQEITNDILKTCLRTIETILLERRIGNTQTLTITDITPKDTKGTNK